MTDGEENNSKEYSLDRVKEMIKHQTEKYSWDFMYIGTDITTKKDANRLCVAKISMSSRKNFMENYDMINCATTTYRVCETVTTASATMDSYLNMETDKITKKFEKEIGKKIE